MKKLLLSLSVATLCTLPLAAQSAAYKEAAVSGGGSITGKVKFAGKDESAKSYTISKDNDVCGNGSREIDFVRVKDGHLLDSVVYLDKVKEGKAFPAEVADATVTQKGCEFSPFLQVMRNENNLVAVNKDPVLHNIHTYELLTGSYTGPKKTQSNVSQPEPNTVTKQVALKKGPAMKIECDAHDFMHGFVFVAQNPYFAVVQEDGSFTIDNVPPGKYTIKAWHGLLKNQKGTVEVAANGTATVDFTFK
ncbi:carboxypeptidase regulatory-like domain-containing protein [Sedimenticola hydrogenitrophicus]|uniref:carboxypeptidase regulatory-like domain-containing protein n=1 Tax=Sedimenticola hydrogenitrophicus TaxID=2967975 RepID=UPI0023AEDF8F|nr:carboxypeptidase regulatory-like domain-containing protein [Sedimenticola hydrogenitrophicus]